MTQDEKWQAKYDEVVEFITTNHRNPSKHSDEERGRILNWIRYNRKLMNAELLKEGRNERFRMCYLCVNNIVISININSIK